MSSLAAILIFLLCAFPAFSQTNDEGLALLQFGFSNPGARAAGMGGAFVGTSDDCTAGATNPAGLTILTAPEAVVDYSINSFRNDIPWNSGTQFRNSKNNTAFQFRNDFVPEDFPESTQNISFISLAYPLWKDKLVLSGFYAQSTNMRREFQTDGFVIALCEDGDDCKPTGLFFPTVNQLRMSLRDFGLAVGFRLQQKVRVGLGLDYWKLDLASRTQRLNPEDGNLRNEQSLASHDGKMSYKIGAIIQVLPPLSLGAVFIRRPGFEVATTNVDILFGTQETQQQFKIPDSLAVGAGWKVNDRLGINFDAVRIFYSQLMDGYYNAFYHQTVLDRFPTDTFATRDFQRTTLRVDDATEFHIGGEWSLLIKRKVINVRSGYWREPFHGLVQRIEDARLQETYDADGNITNDTFATPFTSRSLSDSGHHITFGAGYAHQQFTVDCALDYSKYFTRFLVTTFLFF